MTTKEFRKKLDELLKEMPNGVELICIVSDEESDDFNRHLQGKAGNLRNTIANVLVEDNIFTQIVLDAVKDALIYKNEE